MNRKEKQLAMATAFQSAAPDMIVVKKVTDVLPRIKTKTLVSLLSSVGADPMVGVGCLYNEWA